MSQDQQTYQRAANASLLGLIIQLFLSLFMAVLSVYAKSSALNSATIYFFGGLAVWLILWIIYYQHKLERVESLEAEQLTRSDQEAARLFDEAGQQLALARKRLDNLYKYGINIVSLILGLYLLIAGVWLFISHYSAINFNAVPGSHGEYQDLISQALSASANPLIIGALSAVIGFIGFIVARYVSGMTRQKQWQLLRGGAGYMMGNVVIAVLAVIASIATFFGSNVGFAILALLIPVVMTVLGCEMLLTFLLNVYRPRKHGELGRAAFDSRILGWLSSPESIGKIISETLNYQFGFEISSSWFYRLLSKAVTSLIIIGGLVLFFVSSLVIVGPQQKAIVTAFGQKTHIAQPGISFKWPWPIGSDIKFDTSRIHQIIVGSDTNETEDEPILWAISHEENEVNEIFAPPKSIARKSGVKPSSAELGGFRIVVKYRINDLWKYTNAAIRPKTVLQYMANRQVYVYLASHSIDSMLSGGKEKAAQTLADRLQKDADEMNLGINIVIMSVTEVHPPQSKDVAKAFHDQIGAFQDKQTDIQNARKQAITILAKVAGSREMADKITSAKQKLDEMVNQVNLLKAKNTDNADTKQIDKLNQQIKHQSVTVQKLIQSAGGQAAQTLAEARAYRWQRSLKASGKAERFTARLEAYKNAPYYYTMNLYLESLADNLKNQRKIVLAAPTKGQTPTVRYDLKSQSSGLTSVLENAE